MEAPVSHISGVTTGDQFMPVQRSTLTRPLVAVVMVVASSLFAIAQQPPTPTRVRGTIEAVDGDVLAVKSRAGEDFKLRMTGDMRVVGIAKISLVRYQGRLLHRHHHGAGTRRRPERGRGARVSGRACAVPARDRGRSTCVRTAP